MNVVQEKTLSETETALRELQSRHESAVKSLEAARNTETDLRNQINQAQKEFDAAVEHFKKSAPRETDWQRAQVKAQAVAR